MMKKKEIKIQYNLYDIIFELERDEQVLLEKASAAALDAYAPYSGFNVGAALLLENGTMVIGSNQENAAYPSGLCAERVAVFAAGAQFPNVKIKLLAITAYSKKIKIFSPVTPCGACRQVLAEYEKRYKHSIKIILRGEKGKIISLNSAASLIPLVFDPANFSTPA